MTEAVGRELDEAAPAAFVNGDANPRHRPEPTAQPAPRRGPRRASPRSGPTGSSRAVEPSRFAVPDGIGLALRAHEAWRAEIVELAREQLDLIADAGRELVTVGQALATETDPSRRAEIAWSQALRQLERSLDASTRLVGIVNSRSLDMLDALTPARRGPG